MNAIVPFDFNGQQVRTLRDEHGDPQFVASDVAKILGYRDAEKLTRRLDPEDRGTRSVGTPSGDQLMTVITEPGLYDAVLGSKVPGAREFKRWVIAEVLPTIRKTGTYSTVTHPALPQDYASALRALASEVEERQRAEERAKQLEAPARSWDELASAKGDYSLRDAAQVLSRDHGITIGQNRLMDKIREWGLVDDRDRPYQQYVDRGLIRSRPRTYEHPHTGERRTARPQLRITVKGLHEIRVRLATTNELALTV